MLPMEGCSRTCRRLQCNPFNLSREGKSECGQYPNQQGSYITQEGQEIILASEGCPAVQSPSKCRELGNALVRALGVKSFISDT